MASIVAGIGSSHSIMLMTNAKDWPKFVEVDRVRPSYFDKSGKPTSYDALLATADKSLENVLTTSALLARFGQSNKVWQGCERHSGEPGRISS